MTQMRTVLKKRHLEGTITKAKENKKKVITKGREVFARNYVVCAHIHTSTNE